MKPLDLLLFLFGIALIAFGSLLLVGRLMNLNEPDIENPLVLSIVMGLFFGVAPLVGGVWLCVTRVKKARKQKQEEVERSILKLAKDNGGRLTATEIALKTKFSSDEAAQFLEAMHSKSLIEMEVTEKGSILYRFPGMLSSQEKLGARGYSDD